MTRPKPKRTLHQIQEAKRKRFLKYRRSLIAKQKSLLKNKASPKYNYEKFKLTYLSLKRAAELAGISFPTALKYKTDKRIIKFEKRFSRYTRPRYSWGVCNMFIRMKREAEKKRGPARVRPISNKVKWQRQVAARKRRSIVEAPVITPLIKEQFHKDIIDGLLESGELF